MTDQTRNSRSIRPLKLGLLSTTFAAPLLFASQAPAAPPMMGSAGVGGSAGGGGLLIDYREAVAEMPPRSVDVQLADDGISIIQGTHRHHVRMGAGNLAELLAVVLNASHHYHEVSIDRSMSSAEATFVSDELRTANGVLNIGRDLIDADLAFANIVQGGEWASDPVAAEVAPVLHMAKLLEEDSDYRELTLTLPIPAKTWPKVQFTISQLDIDDPVVVTADMGLRFINPDGHQVLPDGVFITDEVVRQTNRPFQPLLSALANPVQRDELFGHFPELQTARAYALAAAGLAVYCRDYERVCRTWQQQLRLPGPTVGSEGVSEDSFLVGLIGDQLIQKEWFKVRKELAEGTRSRKERRGVFLDEANISLSQTQRWDDESLLKILPVLPSTDYETRLVVRLYRALVRLRAADRPREMHRSLRKIDRALKAIARSRLPEERRKFWAEKASNHLLVMANLVVEKAKEFDLPDRVRVTFRGEHPRGRIDRDEYATTIVSRFAEFATAAFTLCGSDLAQLAKDSAQNPMSQNSLTLRQAFVRSERCHIPDKGVQASLVLEAALHYALGMQASTSEEHRAEAMDRLRMLRSFYVMASGDETVSEFVAILTVSLAQQLGEIA